MSNAYIEKTYGDDLDISLRSHTEILTDLDKVFFDKVAADLNILKSKASSLMSQYLDLNKPCFMGGAKLFSIEINGVSPTVYRVNLEFFFEHDANVYWCVTFNVPLLSPPLERLDKLSLSYWPIELAWRVE